MSAPENPPTVLLVEDDPKMRAFLRALIEGNGYALVLAETGAQGITAAATHTPDVILLDLGLPDVDGLEVTARLREWTQTPIVVISARGLEGAKVKALDAGADDYLTKPFGSGELLARLRVALRHAARMQGEGGAVFEVDALRVDLATRVVTLGGEPVSLTATEYKLLAYMARHAGRVLTHRQILVEVWGPAAASRAHYVRVHMANLRAKIEADTTQPRYLLTEVGVGYRLASE
jgi:two-component system KDP operon response regulator KdpE